MALSFDLLIFTWRDFAVKNFSFSKASIKSLVQARKWKTTIYHKSSFQ